MDKEPHHQPLLSLLFSTASTLVSNVFNIVPGSPQDKPTEPSPNLEQFVHDFVLGPAQIEEEEDDNIIVLTSSKMDQTAPNTQECQTLNTELPHHSPIANSPIRATQSTISDTSKKTDDLENDITETDYQDDIPGTPPSEGAPMLGLYLLEKVSYLIQLHPHLPILLREASSMELLYSFETHGMSLNTLYSKTKDKGPCLVVIKDSQGKVFGAFSNESLSIHHGYHGNGSW